MAADEHSPLPRSGSDPDTNARMRQLPAVEQLAAAIAGPPHLRVAAARAEIAAARRRLRADPEADLDQAQIRAGAEARAAAMATSSLRPLINATGVVLHTNLGRAPLAAAAADAAATVARSYSNLEYETAAGARGSRHAHLEPLLRELTGAEAAIAVNNNAAAVLLALTALAAGGEVIVGRDQLVEIGGSFRIPEILAGSGVRLVEVGTTNRTRLGDYAAAIGTETAALMRVHQSNFRIVGFTETPTISELCGLGRERGIAVIDDLGSGAIEPRGDEPLVGAAVAAGATIVCFSADKLLGGPQAGILAGTEAAVERCRQHPLARAVRLDKLQIAALEATLRLRRDQGPEAIPAVAMLNASEQTLRERAELIATAIGPAARVGQATSKAGGGTLPALELAGPVCVVDPGAIGASLLAERLRGRDPAVIARIADQRLLLDPRTISDAEAQAAATAVRESLG